MSNESPKPARTDPGAVTDPKINGRWLPIRLERGEDRRPRVWYFKADPKARPWVDWPEDRSHSEEFQAGDPAPSIGDIWLAGDPDGRYLHGWGFFADFTEGHPNPNSASSEEGPTGKPDTWTWIPPARELPCCVRCHLQLVEKFTSLTSVPYNLSPTQALGRSGKWPSPSIWLVSTTSALKLLESFGKQDNSLGRMLPILSEVIARGRGSAMEQVWDETGLARLPVTLLPLNQVLSFERQEWTRLAATAKPRPAIGARLHFLDRGRLNPELRLPKPGIVRLVATIRNPDTTSGLPHISASCVLAESDFMSDLTSLLGFAPVATKESVDIAAGQDDHRLWDLVLHHNPDLWYRLPLTFAIASQFQAGTDSERTTASEETTSPASPPSIIGTKPDPANTPALDLTNDTAGSNPLWWQDPKYSKPALATDSDDPGLTSDKFSTKPPQPSPAKKPDDAPPPKETTKAKQTSPATSTPAPPATTPSQPTPVAPAPGPNPQSIQPPPAAAAADTVTLEISPDRSVLQVGERRWRSPLLRQKLPTPSRDQAGAGRELFDAVVHSEPVPGGTASDSTRAGFDLIFGGVRGTNRELRVELILPPELEYRCWERLQAPGDSQPLAAQPQFPFYRRHPSQFPQTSLPVQPLRVLVALANPKGLGQSQYENGEQVPPLIRQLQPVDTAAERRVVQKGFSELANAGLAKVEFLDDAAAPLTKERLQAALDQGYHALHLVAHGVMMDGYVILLADEHGRPEVVPAAVLHSMFAAAKNLRLVVLISCQSGQARLGEGGFPCVGFGAQLAGENIPAVISMQDYLPVPAAQLFSCHFYEHLARTGRVDVSMAIARRQMRGHRSLGEGDWTIPVLHLAGEGKLFDPDPATAGVQPIAWSEPEPATGPDPRPVFRRRALERFAEQQGFEPAQIQGMVAGLGLNGPVRVEMVAGPPAAGGRARFAPQEPANLDALKPLNLELGEVEQFIREEVRLSLASGVIPQIVAALSSGKHLVFTGPPGTGKSELAQALARFVERRGFAKGVLPSTASADWTTFDTVGGYAPAADGRLEFRPGVALSALREGRWLIIDELNRAEMDKAFGEFFTVLAGQPVELPFEVGNHRIRVLPPDPTGAGGWRPADSSPEKYHIVRHPNWRLIGTMNGYDKASLFGLSLAFVRRFAFVEIGVPPPGAYSDLVRKWLEAEPGLKAAELETQRTELLTLIDKCLAPERPLMIHRSLGPAIVRDLVRYTGQRVGHPHGVTWSALFAEAFALYAVPQLDGLDRETVALIYRQLADDFTGIAGHDGLLERVRRLYPHIRAEDWKTALQN